MPKNAQGLVSAGKKKHTNPNFFKKQSEFGNSSLQGTEVPKTLSLLRCNQRGADEP